MNLLRYARVYVVISLFSTVACTSGQGVGATASSNEQQIKEAAPSGQVGAWVDDARQTSQSALVLNDDGTFQQDASTDLDADYRKLALPLVYKHSIGTYTVDLVQQRMTLTYSKCVKDGVEIATKPAETLSLTVDPGGESISVDGRLYQRRSSWCNADAECAANLEGGSWSKTDADGIRASACGSAGSCQATCSRKAQQCGFTVKTP